MNDWAAVIGATWGNGLPTAEKLKIFDVVWNYIDQNYGRFVNFSVNIDSLGNLWRPEIEKGLRYNEPFYFGAKSKSYDHS